jgi:NAD dependent epimerase/dehydratase family enzyme
MKKVILRTSLVLSKGDGVYPRLVKMATFGLGGFQGNGKQWVSWIHEDDVTGALDWILSHTRLEGIFNLTAPEPLVNQDFMKELRTSLNTGLGLPAPAWLLDLGAFIIRTEPELVLKSRWVLPERLLNSGYEFRFPDAASALRNLRK